MPGFVNTPSIEPNYDISGWDVGDEDFGLNVRLNCKQFTINISPENFQESPSAPKDFYKYLDLLASGKDDVEDLWDYLDWIIAPFLPQFESLAPPVEHSGKLTLEDLFSRGSFECQLSVIHEKPSVGVITPVVHDDYEEEFDVRTLKSPFPIFSPSEVEIPYDNPNDALYTIPRQVIVQGLPLFYKSSISIDGSREEIAKYSKITTSSLLPKELPTSRLYGIVSNSKGRICGLLYYRIKADQTLTWAVEANTPAAVREKWASQIKDTLTKLHQLGVVWGDVKAENVLIDEGNAVIIDLEGGTTRGWVDHDKSGTVEGDLQGLEKMVDYIFNDNSVLRPPLGSADEFRDTFEEE